MVPVPDCSCAQRGQLASCVTAQACCVPTPLTVAGRKGKRALNANFIRSGGQQPTADNSAILAREKEQDALDARTGFHLYNEGPPKLGWLLNFNTCSVEDKESERISSAVACYFMCQSGEMFKCKLPFAPYFYLQVKDDRELEVEAYLRRKFEGARLPRCCVCYILHASCKLRKHANLSGMLVWLSAADKGCIPRQACECLSGRRLTHTTCRSCDSHA